MELLNLPLLASKLLQLLGLIHGLHQLVLQASVQLLLALVETPEEVWGIKIIFLLLVELHTQ